MMHLRNAQMTDDDDDDVDMEKKYCQDLQEEPFGSIPPRRVTEWMFTSGAAVLPLRERSKDPDAGKK